MCAGILSAGIVCAGVVCAGFVCIRVVFTGVVSAGVVCVLEACLCNVITLWCYGPLPVQEFTGIHGYSYFYACTVSSCRLDIKNFFLYVSSEFSVLNEVLIGVAVTRYL